jgi:hypothetical protein
MNPSAIVAAWGLPALTLAAGLLAQSPAAAASFAPAGARFTMTGSVLINTATASIGCTARGAQGRISPTGQRLMFTGLGLSCYPSGATAEAMGLPWRAKPTASGGRFRAVTLVSGIQCGPSAVPFTLSSSGEIVFTGAPLAGGCTTTGTLQTTPSITVGP